VRPIEPKKVKTVVIVAMLDSVHTYRWLENVKDLPYRYILFPSSPHRRIHPGIKELLRGRDAACEVVLPRFLNCLSLPLWVIDRFLNDRARGKLLENVIIRSRSTTVHAIEIQHAGYLTLKASLEDHIALYVTNWGSDIYWFQEFEKHRVKIQSLMERANFYSSECARDHELALKLGFKGHFFPAIPNAGGLNLQTDAIVNAVVPSNRKKVIVKGYTNFVGRADFALRAIRLCESELDGYSVVVYSSTLKARWLVHRIRKTTTVNIISIPKKKLTHKEMIQLFSESRVYIGISLSDGISTSLLESMATGCFPIQTSTACADEWIVDEQTGYLISSLNENVIADRIKSCLTDDALVDRASIRNSAVTRARLDQESLLQITRTYYPFILNESL